MPEPAAPVTYRAPGAIFTEREHQVPLDHGNPGGETITVFTREVAVPGGEDRPYLVYLQGGPGFEATRPSPPHTTWQERALKDYRLLMLDQRGTGRSTPVGDPPGDAPEAQAAYLAHFRADSIVRDAELIRKDLGVDSWSILGQSFGGFCAMTYLSLAPDGLSEAFITGGLSPIGRPIDDVYAATWQRTIQKNREYFARYPGDRRRVDKILDRLDAEDVRLPSGDRLTSRRFRAMGIDFGDSQGYDRIHHIVELPFGSRAFLHDAEARSSFGRDPIYATLHEACYADGGATRWSCERTMPAEIDTERLFTGEHIFRWLWEDIGELHSHREAAELLAEREWPRLYDPDVLARNEVPVAAAVYLDDMYVESEFSQETARAIRSCRAWVTNEYEHNGLRLWGDKILDRLIDLARGRA